MKEGNPINGQWRRRMARLDAFTTPQLQAQAWAQRPLLKAQRNAETVRAIRQYIEQVDRERERHAA